ncbi:MAG: DUF2202 domain-containing protein [Chloroflexota bacterium]
MKRTIFMIMMLTALLLAACTETTSVPAPIEIVPNEIAPAVEGTTEEAPMANTAISGFISDMELGELTAEETETLLFMREEEKLARDVYLAMYDQWELQIFQNISSSEQRHMDALEMLIDRYNLEDPVGPELGVFANQTLQDLYDQLVAQGSESLTEALKVGAAIEEIDILDLIEGTAETDNEDIELVYNTLRRGSRNHLRSFVSTLESQTGEVYEAQFMSAEAYLVIINSPMESGHGDEGERGGHGNGQGGNGQGRGGQGKGQGGHGQGGGQWDPTPTPDDDLS